jgi:uncharacterized protein
MMGKPINASVMMTGTVEPDGTVGKVGGIVEKATAAAEAGAKLFIVPEGQSVTTTFVERQTRFGRFHLCAALCQLKLSIKTQG